MAETVKGLNIKLSLDGKDLENELHEQLLLVSITRRAEGEYYEDTQTIIEETAGKTKKKIVKFKKYLPPDVGANKYLLSRLHGEKYNEIKKC